MARLRRSDLPRELLHGHVGLPAAQEVLRRPCDSLHAHVCDAASGYPLCRLRRSPTVATTRAARVYDAVEEPSAPFVDPDALEVALLDVQELLDGQRPLQLAGRLRSGQVGTDGDTRLPPWA